MDAMTETVVVSIVTKVIRVVATIEVGIATTIIGPIPIVLEDMVIIVLTIEVTIGVDQVETLVVVDMVDRMIGQYCCTLLLEYLSPSFFLISFIPLAICLSSSGVTMATKINNVKERMITITEMITIINVGTRSLVCLNLHLLNPQTTLLIIEHNPHHQVHPQPRQYPHRQPVEYLVIITLPHNVLQIVAETGHTIIIHPQVWIHTEEEEEKGWRWLAK